MNSSKQTQESGDNSTNIQAQSINVYPGISYQDAKNIALDVYRENFNKLSTEASQIAFSRAEELTERLFSKISEIDPKIMERMNNPGLQMCIYEAQKEYAKTGDTDLEGLLIDIVVERASITERNIQQIVLDEAIKVASKLTVEQMDALTLCFIVTRTQSNAIVSLPSFFNHLKNDIIQFTNTLVFESTCFEHLEYVGCGSINYVGGVGGIINILMERYSGLFLKGFTIEELDDDIRHHDLQRIFITSSLNNPGKFQVNSINEKVLKDICQNNLLSEELTNKYINLFNTSKLTIEEVKSLILSNEPKMEKAIEYWEKSNISKFNLTTVGIAIAQANFRRRTGVKLDMNVWIK